MPRTLLSLTLALTASLAHADTYHVYFLAGQSNMDGYGLTSDLPESLTGEVDGARIFLGQVTNDAQPVTGAGLWTPLTPGFGTGSSTDGESVTHSDRFGPELTFAVRLHELRPGEKIALIKYAKGGSSIDTRVSDWGTWDPDDARGEGSLKGINQYDHALATIASAMRTQDIDADGEPDTLIPAGILWMQGETDATNPDTAKDYESNLKELIALLREALGDEDLPVVIGRISDSAQGQGTDGRVWEFLDIVQNAQQKIADEDPSAAIVTTTDTYTYSDIAHYDSAGYIDLGKQFAEAMHALRVESDTPSDE